MEYIIKIKDKKVYEALVQFLKTLKIQVDVKSTEQKDNENWNKLAKEEFLKGYHTNDSIYDNE